MSSNKRLYTLDYLRGLAAFGIMIYHYLSWGYGSFPANSFMGKWGLYGVSIFYVLSGLTLYHVYYKKMTPTKLDLVDFYIKRFFRIFPLLWVVLILTIIIHGMSPSWKLLLVNFTGLFSLFRWDAYIGAGVWSIGNELVFYLLFPVFVFLGKWHKFYFYVLTVALFSIYFYFAFLKFSPTTPLSNQIQWSMYVNPLNQALLFLSGYLIGLYCSNIQLSKPGAALILAFSILTFYFYIPQSENLSYGLNRIVLSATSILICFSFYKNKIKLPSLLNRGLTILGEISYSIYLLHPIVWFSLIRLLSKLSIEMSAYLRISVTIVVTILISYFSYHFFESFFISVAKQLSKRITLHNNGNKKVIENTQFKLTDGE